MQLLRRRSTLGRPGQGGDVGQLFLEGEELLTVGRPVEADREVEHSIEDRNKAIGLFRGDVVRLGARDRQRMSALRSVTVRHYAAGASWWASGRRNATPVSLITLSGRPTSASF